MVDAKSFGRPCLTNGLARFCEGRRNEAVSTIGVPFWKGVYAPMNIIYKFMYHQDFSRWIA
jgi:hypothetical protein